MDNVQGPPELKGAPKRETKKKMKKRKEKKKERKGRKEKERITKLFKYLDGGAPDISP